MRSFKRKSMVGLAISAIGLAVVVLAVFWPASQSTKDKVTALPVSDQCQIKSTVTYSCYKEQLTTITEKQGPEKASELIKQAYPNSAYVKSQCHQLMHVVGRAALAKYGNIADTYTHGDQFCWSGYYHGALEQLASQKGLRFLVQNANSICAGVKTSIPRSFYHYNCVHGMGHGYMFVEAGELFKSLADCDSLTDTWERTSCYGGIFMQNIMNEQAPDEKADHTSKYLKVDQPMYPCTAVAEQYKDQCYLMQTSYALQVENYNFPKVFELCAAADRTYRDTCYTSLGRDASGNSISNVEKTRATCLMGTTFEAQKFCVHGAAMDFVSYFHSDQQANQLCAGLPDNLSTGCRETVKNYYSTF